MSARVLSLLVLALASEDAMAQRRPQGIYALVNIADNIKQQQKANPSITPSGLNTYFVNLYNQLLGNPAVAGLALQVHWDTLNPRPLSDANPYDWSYVDDAFSSVGVWNAQNPAQAPKTIQLIVTPGFQSPQWVLDQIPSCDGLFQSPSQTPPSTCGKATFLGNVEAADSTELTLPWNPFYKVSWRTFLTALAAQYGSSPAFVSIAVAGPTAASAEMLLPHGSAHSQSQFGGISPNDVWLQLLAFAYPGKPAYQKSDQAFIDEWNAAIDMYGTVFSGVTLVATTGNGLPNFSNTGFTIPSAFSGDCTKAPDMDCAAETTILSHFADPTAGGANAKATQTSGMEASRVGLALGIDGVKRLSQRTAQLTAPSAQILGGAQFNTSFSNFTLQEGCMSTFPPDSSDTPAGCSIPPSCGVQACIPVACIPQACLAPGFTQANLAGFKTFGNVPSADLIPPEQAAYNVLKGYFDGTPAASFFGGTPGAAPLNYLQIYSPDIQYATAHVNAPAQVVETGGASVAMSAQDLLNLASQKLLSIADNSPTLTAGSAANGATYLSGGLVPGSWAQVTGSNLSSVTRVWAGADFVGLGSNLPAKLSGVEVRVNSLPAAVLYIDSRQVSFQVPDGVTGTASVQVINNGVASNTITGVAVSSSPGIFPIIVNGTNYPAGVFLDGKIVGDPSVSPAFRNAKPGDIIQLFATGLVPTPAGVLPSSQSVSGVTVTIGNITVPADFAGLVAVGEFQINFTVPQQFASQAAGTYPISIQVNGVSSPLTINSIPPGQLVLPIQH